MIDNVQDHLSASDMMVFPSASEGLGITLIEAQANGLPSIVSSEGIPKEADVAQTLNFYSLKKSAYDWASQIHTLKNLRRVNSLSDIRAAGYDIKEEASKLEQFYLSKIAEFE